MGPESGWLNNWEDRKDGDADDEHKKRSAASAPASPEAETMPKRLEEMKGQIDLFPHHPDPE